MDDSSESSPSSAAESGPVDYFFDVTCPSAGAGAAAAQAVVEEFTVLVAKVAAGAILMWFSTQEIIAEVRRLRQKGRS